MPLNRDSLRCQPKKQTEEDEEGGEDVSWVNEPKQDAIGAHLMGAVPSPIRDFCWCELAGNALEMKAIGEPYDGNRHVRFDEGPVETQFGWAPPVYSTSLSMAKARTSCCGTGDVRPR